MNIFFWTQMAAVKIWLLSLDFFKFGVYSCSNQRVIQIHVCKPAGNTQAGSQVTNYTFQINPLFT